VRTLPLNTIRPIAINRESPGIVLWQAAMPVGLIVKAVLENDTLRCRFRIRHNICRPATIPPVRPRINQVFTFRHLSRFDNGRINVAHDDVCYGDGGHFKGFL
tara:strand:- start:1240 stop:1548 length:309 start_codon:yes stop_codon:yes gene_type:complete